MMCSCVAGVYNEYLLKRESGNTNIFVQNIYMYLNSLLCNSIVLLGTGSLSHAFSADALSAIFVPSVVILMVNNAAAGITTSFFLKILNSILKTFTGAIELTVSAVVCYFLFGIPITLNMVISIVVVSYATMLYSLSPVQNLNTKTADYNSETYDPLVHVEKGRKISETWFTSPRWRSFSNDNSRYMPTLHLETFPKDVLCHRSQDFRYCDRLEELLSAVL